jgi:hypothetical protein
MGSDGADLSCPGSNVVADGARFEAIPAAETIGPDRVLSIHSQSHTDESETVERPIKSDQSE